MHKKGVFINEMYFKNLMGLSDQELGIVLKILINFHVSKCISLSVVSCIDSLSVAGKIAILLPLTESVFAESAQKEG